MFSEQPPIEAGVSFLIKPRTTERKFPQYSRAAVDNYTAEGGWKDYTGDNRTMGVLSLLTAKEMGLIDEFKDRDLEFTRVIVIPLNQPLFQPLVQRGNLTNNDVALCAAYHGGIVKVGPKGEGGRAGFMKLVCILSAEQAKQLIEELRTDPALLYRLIRDWNDNQPITRSVEEYADDIQVNTATAEPSPIPKHQFIKRLVAQLRRLMSSDIDINIPPSRRTTEHNEPAKIRCGPCITFLPNTKFGGDMETEFESVPFLEGFKPNPGPGENFLPK